MPFKSKRQQRAAFGGYLGLEMKRKSKTWAHETGEGGSKSHPKGSKASRNAYAKLPAKVKRRKK